MKIYQKFSCLFIILIVGSTGYASIGQNNLIAHGPSKDSADRLPSSIPGIQTAFQKCVNAAKIYTSVFKSPGTLYGENTYIRANIRCSGSEAKELYEALEPVVDESSTENRGTVSRFFGKNIKLYPSQCYRHATNAGVTFACIINLDVNDKVRDSLNTDK